LIAEQTDGHGPALVITLPVRDKIAVSIGPVGMGAFLAWCVFELERVNSWSLFIGAGLLTSLLFLWEKIVVHRTSVRKRVLGWRQVELPGNVTVERRGPLVCLREAQSQFEYRFPKYLKHGGELERRLRVFFQQPGESQGSTTIVRTPGVPGSERAEW